MVFILIDPMLQAYLFTYELSLLFTFLYTANSPAIIIGRTFVPLALFTSSEQPTRQPGPFLLTIFEKITLSEDAEAK